MHTAGVRVFIGCSDSRFEDLKKLVESTAGDYETFYFQSPGGGLCLANKADLSGVGILDGLKFLAKNKNITEIYLSSHEDCLFFKKRILEENGILLNFFKPHDEFRMHEKLLEFAAQRIKKILPNATIFLAQIQILTASAYVPKNEI